MCPVYSLFAWSVPLVIDCNLERKDLLTGCEEECEVVWFSVIPCPTSNKRLCNFIGSVVILEKVVQKNKL